jgi:replicative superfamily II helicase
MLRVFLHYPTEKILYVAPLKALVRERITDWGKGLCKALNKQMVELTGDYTPDVAALLAADIIICTPEKWDGISRNWQARTYVQRVKLVVMDEIHLLGSERGPTLEVIVSRMRYISTITGRPVRFVGLSTALANAHDLASWLGVKPSVCSLSSSRFMLARARDGSIIRDSLGCEPLYQLPDTSLRLHIVWQKLWSSTREVTSLHGVEMMQSDARTVRPCICPRCKQGTGF